MATSIVGTYSGTVAYVDGSNGTFHTQIEATDINQLVWSVNQAISEYNVGNINADAVFGAAFRNILSDSYTFTASASPKAIADVVFHLNFLATLNKRTYPVSITYERGELRDHTGIHYEDISSISGELMDALNAMVALLGGAA